MSCMNNEKKGYRDYPLCDAHMHIAFEMPIVIFYLVVFNIVPYKKLRASWRYVYVGLLVFSAMVTPDGNPVTMLLLFAVLIALYEISLAISRVVLARRIKKQNEELGLDDDEGEDEGADGDEPTGGLSLSGLFGKGKDA